MSAIFAKRLHAERESKGWSQQQFSNMLGITKAALFGYERNYREPDLAILVRIAELLEVTSDYLIGTSDDRRPVKGITDLQSGNPTTRLPEELRKNLEEYRDFLLMKHGLYEE